MNMKQELREDSEQLNPQQTLDKILQVEIDLAEKIAAAEAAANETVAHSKSKIEKVKAKIINQARKDRDRLIQERIAEAHAKAELQIRAAEIESEKTIEGGKAFINEAVERVIQFIVAYEGALES